MALRPASGRMPAWAATPRTVTWISLCVGAEVTMPPSSPVWSYTKPYAARSTEGSKCAAPRRPTSSHGVNTSSIPACGMPSCTTRSTACSMAATAALSSPPRIASRRLVRYSPSCTTSMGPSTGTVSRCAQNMMGTPSAVGAKRATMLLQPAFGSACAASSWLTSAPMRDSSSSTASAMAPSEPDGEGISHRRANRRATSDSAGASRVLTRRATRRRRRRRPLPRVRQQRPRRR